MSDISTFNSKEFGEILESVRINTLDKLKKYYNTNNVDVILTGQHRNIKDQSANVDTGASKSSLGLHNFGAAGDYLIFVDGKRMTGKDTSSLVPYKILGGVAKEHDLFWGWGFDAGHVAKTRFVDEFLTKYPNQANNENVKEWYEMKNSSNNAQAIYKPTLELLDTMYGKTTNRNYIGKERTVDPLLNTIGYTPSEDKDEFKDTESQSSNDSTLFKLLDYFTGISR